VLTAYLAGTDREKAFWQRTIETLDQTDSDLDQAMRLIAEHGAIEVTLERARLFALEARGALMIFPDCPVRQALANVADYTVQRIR
jgi:octaprenyl-diphosphate synthase